MNDLRGNNDPCYRHLADEFVTFETIAVDKLTVGGDKPV